MKTGAQILLDCLKHEGVDTIFGYPGAKTLMIHDLLYDDPDIRHILVRHEQGAAHAADGFARSTGRVGVCLTTSGPGATNLVTGLATAHMDSIPMIALTCQVATANIGSDAFQEADITGITRPITKHNYLVTNVHDLGQIIRQAFHIARTGRPGPVLIDLPSDILASRTNDTIPEKVICHGYREKPPLNLKQLKRAADIINRSKRPVIYAGGGIIQSDGVTELRALAHKGNIPVAHTLMAIGVMESFSPYNLGMLGMYGSWKANKAVHESDCVVAIGARFDERVTGRVDGFATQARIIHIDIDPSSIRKIVKVDLPIAADAKEAVAHLSNLLARRDRSQWNDLINGWKRRVPQSRRSDQHLLPQEIIETIAQAAGPSPIVASDVGLSQMWTANYFGFDNPRQYLTSGGLGTMGYALPAAMGAAVGNPQRTVLAITGDGAFQMNIQELATCSYYGIPVKIIVFNNGKLGMVRQFQNIFLKKRYAATDLGRHVDFSLIARGFGLEAFKITRHEELRKTMDRAMACSGPVMVDLEIDPDCFAFPIVPPGRRSLEAIYSPEEWEA